MELKYLVFEATCDKLVSFNRTFMELKLYNIMDIMINN